MSGADSATIRPDSATATVKDSLTVRAGSSRLGPEKSQRDPDGSGLVDPNAALLLLDFARDLCADIDDEIARAVYHAIGGALGALREQMPEVRR